MRYEYFRQRSIFSFWAWRLASFAALLMLAVLVGYLFKAIEGRLLYAFLSLIMFLGFLGFLSALWAFFDVWKYGDIAGWPAFFGGGLSLLLCCFVGMAFWNSAQSTQDISTNLAYPPQFIEPLELAANSLETSDKNFVAVTPLPPSVGGAQQLDFWGRRYGLSASVLSAIIVTLLQKKQWPIFTKEITEHQQKQFLIQTQSKLFFLPHLSEIILRVIDEKGNSSYLDLRSLYLRGMPDFGLNKKIMAKLLAEIEEEVVHYQLNASDEFIILNRLTPDKE